MKQFKEIKVYKEPRIFVRPVQSSLYSMRDEMRRLREMPRVIKGDKVKWKGGPVDPTKHFVDPHTGITQSLHLHYIDLAPRGKSKKHGHQNEAILYVLEGKGYEIHDGIMHEWNAGDLVLIHAGSVHQHFNADPDKPARGMIFKGKPLCMFLNLIYQDFVEASPKQLPTGHEDYTPVHLRELL
jgi:quercetin dioxygenase-like cupin family protein